MVGEYPFSPKLAVRALKRCDPQLARAVDRVGPFRLELHTAATPFQMLVRSIVHQQLSGQAARAIEARLTALFPHRPTAARVLAISPDVLRNVGLSKAKVLAVKALAAHALGGGVPTRRRLERMSDAEIAACLTQIRGVGRWTVDMLLIFYLARPDVLPVTDLGIRKGLMHVYQMRRLPTPQETARTGETWRPYRSVASWYLWRSLDHPA
ncbi:MAG: DNA-3-methyladenine glycosylase 2 family protein [Gammaproteobacteria bacterium]|nr:DNA-3-methyladenine glycosylase 2 family protein [Gammaproteobacteria bacterium]